LEFAKAEKEQIEAQVMRQREENAALEADYERARFEAAAIRAKMLAAKDQTDETAKASQEFIHGCNLTTSASLPAKVPQYLTINSNHERFNHTAVLSGPGNLSPPFSANGGRIATPVTARDRPVQMSQARRCLRDVVSEITPATKEADHLLRAVKEPIQTYSENHLKTLRAVRHLAVYLDKTGEEEQTLGLCRWARGGPLALAQLGPNHPCGAEPTYYPRMEDRIAFAAHFTNPFTPSPKVGGVFISTIFKSRLIHKKFTIINVLLEDRFIIFAGVLLSQIL
jgi:hypothetical protein